MQKTDGASEFGASLVGRGFDIYKFVRQPQTIVRLLSWVSACRTSLVQRLNTGVGYQYEHCRCAQELPVCRGGLDIITCWARSTARSSASLPPSAGSGQQLPVVMVVTAQTVSHRSSSGSNRHKHGVSCVKIYFCRSKCANLEGRCCNLKCLCSLRHSHLSSFLNLRRTSWKTGYVVHRTNYGTWAVTRMSELLDVMR